MRDRKFIFIFLELNYWTGWWGSRKQEANNGGFEVFEIHNKSDQWSNATLSSTASSNQKSAGTRCSWRISYQAEHRYFHLCLEFAQVGYTMPKSVLFCRFQILYLFSEGHFLSIHASKYGQGRKRLASKSGFCAWDCLKHPRSSQLSWMYATL